jgi:hypothetical protein
MMNLFKIRYFAVFFLLIALFFFKDSLVVLKESVFLSEQEHKTEEEHVAEENQDEEDLNEVDEGILPAAIIKSSTSSDTDVKEPSFKAPEKIKAIYLTSWSASTPYRINYAIDLAENTEINAVVIDIKDWSGYISYDTEVPEAQEYNAERFFITDVKTLVERFHKEDIYVIARITVFQDPVFARSKPDLAVRRESDQSLPWLDKSGLAWIDPAAEESWDYNIAIAKDALKQGFDEINFDYVRFPTDGDLKNMSFPVWNASTTFRHQVIKSFYSHLREQLPDAVLSIDLFGLSTVASNFGVGQNIEDAYQYFDFVCPMVYPSHYAEMYLGYENPAEYPYEIVKYSMQNALSRLKAFNEVIPTDVKLRPWLQDFDLGADYDEGMVRLEIDAVYDTLGEGFSGFMLWSADNFYTKEALSTTTQNLLE